MWFFLAIFLSLVLGLSVWLVGRYWDSLQASHTIPPDWPLSTWVLRGLIAPIMVWLAFNFLLFPGRVTAMPRITLSGATGEVWSFIALELLVPALPVMASCWAALTLVWLMAQLVQHTEGRHEFVGAAIFWGVLLSPVAALILYWFGAAGVGAATLVLVTPILRDLLALGPPKFLSPVYERALQRLREGEASAAELEILRQLERREDDFRGWMLLASLYAQHFHDLPEAERTIRQLCRQPNLSRSEYCEALTQLGDWFFQADDTLAAGRVWREIMEKFPHSEFADVARRRLQKISHARTAGD
jgi:hypothetical protein